MPDNEEYSFSQVLNAANADQLTSRYEEFHVALPQTLGGAGHTALGVYIARRRTRVIAARLSFTTGPGGTAVDNLVLRLSVGGVLNDSDSGVIAYRHSDQGFGDLTNGTSVAMTLGARTILHVGEVVQWTTSNFGAGPPGGWAPQNVVVSLYLKHL